MHRKFRSLDWYDGEEFDDEQDVEEHTEWSSRRSIFEDPYEVFIQFLVEEYQTFIEVSPSGQRTLVTVDEETGLETREVLPDKFS